MNTWIRSKGVGTFMNLIVLALAIITLVVYIVYATSAEGLMVLWVVGLLGAIIAGEVILFFFDNDYIPIFAAAASMAALGCFAFSPPETIGSVVDYFQNIVMFGNPENFQIIAVIAVLMLVMGVMAIVSCFFERIKK